MSYLGIDTSNYTTSCAVFGDDGTVISKKKLLPVKQGERGLRQSDAVFHHTVQLPSLIEELFSETDYTKINAIGVSDVPMRSKGSYMPCFLTGVAIARSISALTGKPLYRFSHQQGHIMAALYSSKHEELIKEEFIAFHVSGGTTQALSVSPDENEIFYAKPLTCSLDLKAGQAVDRAGVLMGFPFPSGKYVDEYARRSDKEYKINVKLKDGNCCLSGIENKVTAMVESGESKEHISRFVIDSILFNLDKMASYLIEKYGRLPLVFSGGVMSNTIIKKQLSEKYGAYFAEPEFSCDNAAGTAILAALKHLKDLNIK